MDSAVERGSNCEILDKTLFVPCDGYIRLWS